LFPSHTDPAAQFPGFFAAPSEGSDKLAAFQEDPVAVSGDPREDMAELQKVKFVMKGGIIFKNEITNSRTKSRSDLCELLIQIRTFTGRP